MSLLEVEDLSVSFRVEGGTLEAVRQVSFAIDQGETAGAGRRERLGQIGDRALDPPAAALPQGLAPGRQHPPRRPGADRRRRGDAARGPGRSGRHHLPGADDLAQPAAQSRKAGQRDPAAAPRPEPDRGAQADPRAPAPGPAPGGRAAPRRLPAPALGRPAPAGHDRDGARQRARPPDRRRADDRPRRHDPGPDPDPAPGPAAPPRHGDAA